MLNIHQQSLIGGAERGLADCWDGRLEGISLPPFRTEHLKQLLSEVSLDRDLGLSEHFEIEAFCLALKRLTGGVPKAVSQVLQLMMGSQRLTIAEFQKLDKDTATTKLVEWMTEKHSPVYNAAASVLLPVLSKKYIVAQKDIVNQAFYNWLFGDFIHRDAHVGIPRKAHNGHIWHDSLFYESIDLAISYKSCYGTNGIRKCTKTCHNQKYGKDPFVFTQGLNFTITS